MDEFRGLRARMQETAGEPLSRRARKRRERASVDLSTVRLTPEQVRAFIAMIDDILPTMERPQ